MKRTTFTLSWRYVVQSGYFTHQGDRIHVIESPAGKRSYVRLVEWHAVTDRATFELLTPWEVAKWKAGLLLRRLVRGIVE